jgi:hypothetical protein
VSKVGFFKQSAMRLVFNGKEKLRSLSEYGENPMARYSCQRFDGNVEVVTWSKSLVAVSRYLFLMRLPFRRDTATELCLLWSETLQHISKEGGSQQIKSALMDYA